MRGRLARKSSRQSLARALQDAAGDAGTGIARGVGPVIIRACVDNDRGSVRIEESTEKIIPSGTKIDIGAGSSRCADHEIRQVAKVLAVGV